MLSTLNPTLLHKRYTIESKGRRAGFARQLEVIVQPDFYSNYLYFTDTEHQPGLGNPLWFYSNDVIDGPMFTNDQISIFGDPMFYGLARYVTEKIGKDRFDVVPHVSSMQLAFARVKESWEDAYLANLGDDGGVRHQAEAAGADQYAKDDISHQQ